MPENANQKAQDTVSYYTVNVSEKPTVFPVLYGEALQSCEQATSEQATRENLCLRKFSNLSSAKVYT